MIPRAIGVMCVAGFLTGCGGQTYVRETTRTLAADVASLQKSIARYTIAQQDAADQRIERIMKQRQQLALGDDEITAQIAKLEEEDPALPAVAKSLFDGAVAAARGQVAKEQDLADRLVSEREALKTSQTRFDPQLASQLATLASQLRDLGTFPSLKTQAKSIFEYFKSTSDEVGKLEKAAKDSNTKAGTPAGGTGQ